MTKGEVESEVIGWIARGWTLGWVVVGTDWIGTSKLGVVGAGWAWVGVGVSLGEPVGLECWPRCWVAGFMRGLRGSNQAWLGLEFVMDMGAGHKEIGCWDWLAAAAGLTCRCQWEGKAE